MKGSEKVIEQLNAALSDEMSAAVQYMVQAEMCSGWGYHRLSALTKARASGTGDCRASMSARNESERD